MTTIQINTGYTKHFDIYTHEKVLNWRIRLSQYFCNLLFFIAYFDNTSCIIVQLNIVCVIIKIYTCHC